MLKPFLEFPQLLDRQPWRSHEIKNLTLRLPHTHGLLGDAVGHARRDDEHTVRVAVQKISR
jgi:hypothetical protein